MTVTLALAAGDDCVAVRASIDLALDATILPDATILLAQFAGAALTEVTRRDPDIGTRSDDELTHYHNAVIALTAANLVPRLKWLSQEQFGGTTAYRYIAQSVDIVALEQRLRSEAAIEMDLVLAAGDPAAERPIGFAAAGPARWPGRGWGWR